MPHEDGQLIQECGAGLVTIRRTDTELSFQASPRVVPLSDGGTWTYLSIAGWATAECTNGQEFVLCTAEDDVRAIELLAMTVFYNRTGVLGLVTRCRRRVLATRVGL